MLAEKVAEAFRVHASHGILVVWNEITHASWGEKLQAAKATQEVPNALTQLRLILTPVQFVLLVLGHFFHFLWWFALLIWIIGCLSDYYDGKWSRGWGHVSDYGKYWDPFADKFFTLPTIVTMAILNLFPSADTWLWLICYIAWLVYAATLTYRELHVTHLRNVYLRVGTGGSVAADKTGKYKTALIMIGVALVLLQHCLQSIGLEASWIGWIGWIGGALMVTAWGFAIYSWLFVYEKAYRV